MLLIHSSEIQQQFSIVRKHYIKNVLSPAHVGRDGYSPCVRFTIVLQRIEFNQCKQSFILLLVSERASKWFYAHFFFSFADAHTKIFSVEINRFTLEIIKS